MQVTPETFQKLANQVSEKVTNIEGLEHKVWRVPAAVFQCGV